MKKKLLILSLVAICLSICISGTLAYFTATDTAKNTITAGSIEIELVETDSEGNPFEDVSSVMPGAEIDKIVTVKNVSGNPCWVRISVEKAISLAEGKDDPVDLSLLHINFNTMDWTESEGFYYYNEVLEGGETTKPLFTIVSFDTAMLQTLAEWKPVLIFAGAAFLVCGFVLFLTNRFRKRRGAVENRETVAFLREEAEARKDAAQTFDGGMPTVSYYGEDYAAILEIPGQSAAFPVLAAWNRQTASEWPCRFSGDPYGGTTVIGWKRVSGYFEEFFKPDLGEALVLSDLRGQRFLYRISSVREVPVSGNRIPVDENYDLIIFGRTKKSAVWRILACKAAQEA